MKYKLVAFALSLSVFFAACSGNNNKTVEQHSDAPKVAASGEELFMTHCKTCHGADGTMGLSGAKNLKLSTLDKASIVNQVTNGKGMMASFKDRIAPEDIDKIADFVLTLRK
jgi:cytochrome c6